VSKKSAPFINRASPFASLRSGLFVCLFLWRADSDSLSCVPLFESPHRSQMLLQWCSFFNNHLASKQMQSIDDPHPNAPNPFTHARTHRHNQSITDKPTQPEARRKPGPSSHHRHCTLVDFARSVHQPCCAHTCIGCCTLACFRSHACSLHQPCAHLRILRHSQPWLTNPIPLDDHTAQKQSHGPAALLRPVRPAQAPVQLPEGARHLPVAGLPLGQELLHHLWCVACVVLWYVVHID